MKLQELKNKKIAILGFGLEGQSTLRFLMKQGIEDITILDKNVIQQDISCKVITGDSYLDILGDFDLIFKSPGVSPFGEMLLPHREKFISQAQIFFDNYDGKVIWITGTKGKSTISTLLYTCLEEAWYKVKLVWNIGNPVLDEIDIISWDTYDYIVYEMSSYMLQDFTPELYIGFLNNIYPCHLDWHFDSMNIYKEAKLNILQNAENKVVNSELKGDTEILGILGEKIFFGEVGKYRYQKGDFYIHDKKILDDQNIALNGEHNRKNISWVMAILDTILWDEDRLKDLLAKLLPDFKWLPHRIEDIWSHEGIRFINDAIATTPESTIAAIKTFEHDLQTIFLWWEDSGFDFSKIRQKVFDSQIQNIVAFPDTSEKIFPEIGARDYEIPFEIEIAGKTLQMIKTRSMKSAVDFAYKTTFPGKIALLSCAAPSFSLWRNYKLKAEEFIKEVREY